MILYNMPFNVEKWMASPSVRDMTRQEQAAYLLLLVECWSRDGYLDQSNIEAVKNGGGCQWKRAVDSVVFKMFLHEKPERFGTVSDSFSDRFYNETQLKMFENLVKTEKKRAEIGKVSAQKRWDTHRQPIGSPIPPVSSIQYPITNNHKEGADAPKKNDELFPVVDNSKPKKQPFVVPTLEEVKEYSKTYCHEKSILAVEDYAQEFLDYWNERKWVDKTKTPVTDWKARFRTFMRFKKSGPSSFSNHPTSSANFGNVQRPTDAQKAANAEAFRLMSESEEIPR